MPAEFSRSKDAIHHWIKSHFGKPDHCEVCGEHSSDRRYNWVNIKNHQYTHERSDYKMMCVPCHRKYDMTPEKIESNRKAGETRMNQISKTEKQELGQYAANKRWNRRDNGTSTG